MEPTTCVVDAANLIEHIHEIKSWTYNGYLNIVVPLCTIERVEQLYKTKKEQQEVKVLDPPKKRLSWKNVRKEHPAFDINLQVALEFVKRMEIEEPKTSVTFQKASEEYSPWKGIEVQQEKPEIKEDRPSTFAQALAKSNTPNGLSGVANAPKGPVKPKLVAKASGIDLSPWKMNKRAPRVLPSEVPEALRPLLSYTLWRLYENVATWSDSNPTVILSNDPKLSAMAHKLNIIVKQIGQLRQAIATKKTNDSDPKMSGDLERDFGLSELENSPLENGNIDQDSENLVSQVEEDSELNKPVVFNKTLNGDHASLEKSEDTPANVVDEGSDRQTTESKMNNDTQENRNGHLGADQGEQKAVNKELNTVVAIADSDILKKPERISDKSESPVSNDEKPEVSQKPVWIMPEVNVSPKVTDIFAKGAINDAVAVKADDLPAKAFSAKAENASFKNECTSPSVPAPLEKHSGFLQENCSEFSQLESSSRPATVNGSSSSSRQSSHEPSSLPTQVTQEPEDSDEEVVVFNPRAKRFSTNQKPTQPIPAPKPKPIISDAPKTALATVSTIVSVASFGTGSTATSAIATSPKLASAVEISPKFAAAKANSPKISSARTNSYRPASARGNHAKSNAGRNSRPQTPLAPAAVIDPDFFGRNSVVNVRSNVQNEYPRNSPRGSPRRGPRNPDSDVDYVLTSGATREAARGKGKLWVP